MSLLRQRGARRAKPSPMLIINPRRSGNHERTARVSGGDGADDDRRQMGRADPPRPPHRDEEVRGAPEIAGEGVAEGPRGQAPQHGGEGDARPRLLPGDTPEGGVHHNRFRTLPLPRPGLPLRLGDPLQGDGRRGQRPRRFLPAPKQIARPLQRSPDIVLDAERPLP